MNELIDKILFEPWPWWVGGPLIGFFVLVLLILENKQLGISSSYNYICSKLSPFKPEYLKDVKKVRWQFFFVVGIVFGGGILYYVNEPYQVDISLATVSSLSGIGITEQDGYVPKELFNFSTNSVIWLVFGGFFLGFGARYANGCTAGHAIMGVSQLAPASIISTICFFIGGLLATYFILPVIF